MANCCINNVSFSGDKEQLKKLVELVGDKFDFNKIIPLKLPESATESNEKWGCPSIAFDVQSNIDEEFSYVDYSFWTKWTPPCKVFLAIRETFPDIEINWNYEEPGNELYGYLQNDYAVKSYDFYIIKMEGCVEPVLVGPLSEEVAQERLSEYQEDPSECENAHFIIKVTKGAEVEV